MKNTHTRVKSLEQLIDRLDGEKKILVTGPCRSGTTLCSHILHDLLDDYEYIDSYGDYEDSTKCRVYATGFPVFLDICEKMDRFIVHGPHFHPFLQNVPNDVMVVFMRRNCGDVTASTQRIFDGKWGDEFYVEKMRNYLVEIKVPEGELKFFDKLSYPGKVYYVWDSIQQFFVKKSIEVDYDILSEHRFFIPKNKRLNFRERQWYV